MQPAIIIYSVTTWLSMPVVHFFFFFFFFFACLVLHREGGLPAPPTWIWSINFNLFSVLSMYLINDTCIVQDDVWCFYLANKMK